MISYSAPLNWHVTKLTDEAAMRHARLRSGLQDRPDVTLGWTPYNYLVSQGAMSTWACHTAAEFEAWQRRMGLHVREWLPEQNGVQWARLETQAEYLLRLAWERGKIGSTFATADEHRAPGYSDAWAAGREAGRREQEGGS
jgi:hypothetical protein